MKNLSAIIFLFVFLGTTEFKELYRIPNMVEHFLKHKKENSSMSFIAFLKLHYTHEKQNDNDDKEDAQLPFKNISDSIVSSSFSDKHFFITGIMIAVPLPHYTICYSVRVPDNFGHSLFRPPRLA